MKFSKYSRSYKPDPLYESILTNLWILELKDVYYVVEKIWKSYNFCITQFPSALFEDCSKRQTHLFHLLSKWSHSPPPPSGNVIYVWKTLRSTELSRTKLLKTKNEGKCVTFRGTDKGPVQDFQMTTRSRTSEIWTWLSSEIFPNSSLNRHFKSFCKDNSKRRNRAIA